MGVFADKHFIVERRVVNMIVVTVVVAVLATLEPATSAAASTGRCGDYSTLINMSTLFYETQRSGKLPATQRVTWRKDSALSDKGNNNEDLSGGYYDGKELLSCWEAQAIHAKVLFHEAGSSSENAAFNASLLK